MGTRKVGGIGKTEEKQSTGEWQLLVRKRKMHMFRFNGWHFLGPPLSERCGIYPTNLEPCHISWERRAHAKLLMATHVTPWESPSTLICPSSNLSSISHQFSRWYHQNIFQLPAVTHTTVCTPSPAPSTVSGPSGCSIKICWMNGVQEDFFVPEK